MDDEKAQLIEELRAIRARAEEIGRRLREIEEKKERRPRLWLIPGGAAVLALLGSFRRYAKEASVVAAAATVVLLSLPGGEVAHDPQLLPPPARPTQTELPEPPATPTRPEPVVPGTATTSMPVEPGTITTSVPVKPDAQTPTVPVDPGTPPPVEEPEPTPEPVPGPEPEPSPDPEPGGDPRHPLLHISADLDPLLRLDLRLSPNPKNRP